VEKQEDGPAAVPASIGDPVVAVERANALVTAVLSGLLKRKLSITAALMYILALGRDVRANCWDLSEKAGLEPGDGTFHRLLGRYRWSWERGRELLPLLAQEALGAAPDVDGGIGPGLAVDETTDLKRGTGTACVSPQHSGVTGKTENCVTWVFSALVTASGQCWAWFDLYMPDCRAQDPARRKKAGIPRSLRFATKPELAIAQVATIIKKGVRICWAAAGEVYGRSGDFRAACRALLLSYVVIIPCDYKVVLAKGTAKVKAEDAARDAVFERRSAGNGTKGPRWGWWALIATADPDEFLLVRKLDREKNPYTYYLCHAAPGRPATLNHFVAITGSRWPVEVGHRCYRSSGIRFSRLSSLSFFLCFSGSGRGWCPAGAGVVAGRAVPALPELSQLLLVGEDDPVPAAGSAAGGDPAAVDPVVDAGGGHAELGGQSRDRPLARVQVREDGGPALGAVADGVLADDVADLLAGEDGGALGRAVSLGVQRLGDLPAVASLAGEPGDAGAEGGEVRELV
jgi:hypothetical protein